MKLFFRNNKTNSLITNVFEKLKNRYKKIYYSSVSNNVNNNGKRIERARTCLPLCGLETIIWNCSNEYTSQGSRYNGCKVTVLQKSCPKSPVLNTILWRRM